jgi:prepilin signal peptidase PulO-like enzyme (type II secretory pathway)
MDKKLSNPLITMKLAFWRAAASAMGFAVRKKKNLERAINFAPFAVAGAVAYLLGRLIGELLL